MLRGQSKKRRKSLPNKGIAPAAKQGKFFSTTEIDKRASQPYIPLFCAHCGTQSVTTGDYTRHLTSARHVKYLKRNIENHEADLVRMRNKQKEAQEKADEADRLQGLPTVVKHCEICDLDYHQEESKHVDSKLHKALQELLQRECKRCSYKSESIEEYEIHLGSLEHLMKEEAERCKERFKACDIETDIQSTSSAFLEGGSSQRDSQGPTPQAGHGKRRIEKMDIQSTSKAAQQRSSSSSSSDPPSPKEKTDFVAGKSTLTEVLTMYCEVCKQYLDHRGDREAVQKAHCQTNDHLINWIKHTEKKYEQQQKDKEM